MFNGLIKRLSESSVVRTAGKIGSGAVCVYGLVQSNVSAEEAKTPPKQIPLVKGVRDYRIGERGYNAFLMRVEEANSRSPTQILYILRDLKTGEQLRVEGPSKTTTEIDENKTLHPGKVYTRVVGRTQEIVEGGKKTTEPNTTESDLIVLALTQRKDDGTIEVAPEGTNPAPYVLLVRVKKADDKDARQTDKPEDTLTLEFEGRRYSVRYAEGIGGTKGSIVTRSGGTTGIDSIFLTPLETSKTVLKSAQDPFGNDLNEEIKVIGTHYTLVKVTSRVEKVEERTTATPGNEGVIQEDGVATEPAPQSPQPAGGPQQLPVVPAEGQGAAKPTGDQAGQGAQGANSRFRPWSTLFGPRKKAPAKQE